MSFQKPLLNTLNEKGLLYEYERDAEADEANIYDIGGKLRGRTHINEERFHFIYRNTMRFFTQQEKYSFRQYQTGEKPKEEFFRDCGNYLKRSFPEMNNENDFNVMMKRIDLAIFQYDVVQPLIDHEDTTDIKICSHKDIRVRIKGKAYRSSAQFYDEGDLIRFIEGLGYRNGVDIYGHSMISFADNHDANYILRFSISNPVINAVDYPYIHIRKISKQKKFFKDLEAEGMLNENISRYITDRASKHKGIVFAGPPGSGKTTLLNAFLEYIPKTRETLVIQETDELYTEQSGFMFKHVTHGFKGEPITTLEDLAKMALVEGCNQFVIGEVKGGEMRYAMTLLNAGGHIALTVHSTNAYETLDKLADLVKYGSSYSFSEARRMLKTIDTIVYMEGYKVREIIECEGYDDEKGQYEYREIYNCKYD